MAFSTKRGRPRQPTTTSDFGTPELQWKQVHGLTAEPIDLCLARNLISDEQHRGGLHLRWLHTLRYGAPRITTCYTLPDESAMAMDDPAWRSLREREYAEAIALLRAHRRHDPVIRLTVYNEMPHFLNPEICKQSWNRPQLASQLDRERQHIHEGLTLLVEHWKT